MDERPWLAHVTVATVVETDGRFLMVEEWDNGRKVLNQPAGHLDPAETLVEAAVRETLEETGWHVAVEHLIGATLYPAPNGITYYRTTFFASPIREEKGAVLDQGIIRPLWMTREEMQQREADMRSALVIQTVDQYLSNKIYPLDFFY